MHDTCQHIPVQEKVIVCNLFNIKFMLGTDGPVKKIQTACIYNLQKHTAYVSS
jgi:hypothetical protein